jgi:hypothetical protein
MNFPASPSVWTPFTIYPVNATPEPITELISERKGLMEINAPPTLCPSHEVAVDIF